MPESTLQEERRQPALNTRIPEPMMRAIDLYASRCGVIRSAATRELIAHALRDFALWPPPLAETAPS